MRTLAFLYYYVNNDINLKEKNMNNYYIYLHENKLNGKVYIGQTCQKPQYRWNHGQGYKNCDYFYRAIQKYGWDNFNHTILAKDLTLEEANYLEEYYISIFDSTNPESGYNLQKGGLNKEPNEYTRKKLSEHMKKLWEDPNFRQQQSERMKKLWENPEYREKVIENSHRNWHLTQQGRKNISEARKQYIKQHGTPTQGKGHTQETKEKIRQAKLGEKNPMYGKHTSQKQKQAARERLGKKVRCIETGEIFNSCKEAAAWCGLKSGTGIGDYLAGRKKSAGKHPQTKIPLHWEEVK